MAKIKSMNDNAEKDFIEKMKQHQEEQENAMQQLFEERWKETIENDINEEGKIYSHKTKKFLRKADEKRLTNKAD